MRLARFFYDFVVGDDWRVAVGVVVAVAVTAAVATWWLLPLAAAGLLLLAVWR